MRTSMEKRIVQLIKQECNKIDKNVLIKIVIHKSVQYS